MRAKPNLWVYEKEVIDKFWTIPQNTYGFIYLITNCINNRKYIGRKSFYRNKFKRGNKYKIETNWRDYMGSSRDLKEDVAKFGIKNFQRKILELTVSSYNTSYLETKYLFINECIESDDYYNKSILGKFYSDKIFK